MIDVFLLLLDELAGSTHFYVPILAAVFFGFGFYILHKRFSYPQYILRAVIASAVAFFLFVFTCICMELLYNADAAVSTFNIKIRGVGLALFAVAVLSVLVMLAAIVRTLYVFVGFRRKLRETIQCTQLESLDYSPIAAWRVLESLPPSKLTRRQKEAYEKYRIYLRMLLGNFNGVAGKLEKLREKDKAYYHFLKCVQYTAMGNMKDAAEEIQQAEENANADTEPLIMGQIMLNRGVGYVGVGYYEAADDAFARAILYCRKNRIKEKTVWETLYYNYVFNRIRLNPDMQRQEWEALMEPLKTHLDMENPRDYIAYANIELELLRQTNADRGEINSSIHESFDYLMQRQIPINNRCVLEASFARMVWAAMGDPADVLQMLESDRDHLLKLPMPARYNCFHQIDIFFADLHGEIVEKYDKLKQSAFWYMMNQAQQDLEEYRRSLPAEAVYERCFCLKELAGRCKKNPQDYRWEAVADWLENAAALYRENGLELEAILCNLNMMDEATSLLNMNQDMEPIRKDEMEIMLERIEEAIPKFKKHPVMAGVSLRLSFYCCIMHDYDRCRTYFEMYQHLQKIVSLQHFAPWMHRYYMVAGFVVRALYFLDAVRAIREELKGQGKTTLADDWFLQFGNCNGVPESVALAMILGIEDGMLLKTKFWPLEEGECFCRMDGGLAGHMWLFLPQLGMEIDLTYSQFVQDTDKDRIFFNQGYHPMEKNRSNFLRGRKLDTLPLFAGTYVREVCMAEFSPEQQAALHEVCDRITDRLPQECPTVEMLFELYRLTMLPVSADGFEKHVK